jgi:hypothetical protein
MNILEKIDNLIEERKYYDDANDDPFFDPPPEPRYVPINNRLAKDEDKRRDDSLTKIKHSIDNVMKTTASSDEDLIKSFMESLQAIVDLFAVGNQQYFLPVPNAHMRRNYGYIESITEAIRRRRTVTPVRRKAAPYKPKKVLTTKQENDRDTQLNKLKTILNQEVRGVARDADLRFNAIMDATENIVQLYRTARRHKSRKDW